MQTKPAETKNQTTKVQVEASTTKDEVCNKSHPLDFSFLGVS